MEKKYLWFLFVAILMTIYGCGEGVKKELPVYGLVKRLLSKHAKNFTYKEIPSIQGKDVFEIESQKGKILISGNNGVSMARGLNHYLKNYCHASTSWCGDNLNLSDLLPVPEEKIRIQSPFKYRYYLNYCTHSYSMAFWDWERWEKEIDWMALICPWLSPAREKYGKILYGDWDTPMRKLWNLSQALLLRPGG